MSDSNNDKPENMPEKAADSNLERLIDQLDNKEAEAVAIEPKKGVLVMTVSDRCGENHVITIDATQRGSIHTCASSEKLSKETFGTGDASLQETLAFQAMRTFSGYETSIEKWDSSALVKHTRNTHSALRGIAPRDEIEGMLAVQMVGIHNLAMEFAGRAASANHIDVTERFTNCAVKLSRTFTSQVEALKKYRTGGSQRMTVEHIHVNEGGQAVVGNIHQGGAQNEKGKTTP